MIHGRDHRDHGLAVSEGKNGYLGACEEFLDNDPGAALAEFQLVDHLMDSSNGLILILSDDNALAQSQTVSLDNCRIAVLLLEVSDSAVAVGEDLIEGSRNVVLLHELL